MPASARPADYNPAQNFANHPSVKAPLSPTKKAIIIGSIAVAAVAALVAIVAVAILVPPVAAAIGLTLTGVVITALGVTAGLAFGTSILATITTLATFLTRRSHPSNTAPQNFDVSSPTSKKDSDASSGRLGYTDQQRQEMISNPPPQHSGYNTIPLSRVLSKPFDVAPLAIIDKPSLLSSAAMIAGSPPPSTSPKPVGSEPVSRASSPLDTDTDIKVLQTYQDITPQVAKLKEKITAEKFDTPGLGFDQSMMPVDKSDEFEDFVMVGGKDANLEAFPEDLTSQEKEINKAGGIVAFFHQFDITKQYPEAVRIKAMKYEALLGTVNQSLTENKLPLIPMPSEQDPLAQLTALRDAFEVTALDQLRSGVENGPDKEKYNAVCYALYTRNNLDQANHALIGMLGLSDPKGGPGILDRLDQSFETVNKADPSKTTHILNRWARSLKDKLGLWFSPIGAGNPPQRMFKLKQGEREIDIIAFGSPTIQSSNITEVTIDPVFKGYLRHLKVNGQKHLYVSNQNTLNEENARNSVIMALAEDPEFKGTFIAMTQSKNTRGYHAKAKSGETRAAISLRQRLHNSFFIEPITKSGCGLTEDLKNNKDFEQFSNNILKDIHNDYFNSKKELTESEEKLFIELYYNFLTLKIAQDQGVNYLNFTCKDGIDRGMGSLAWFIMMIEFSNGRAEDPKVERYLITTFFTRAYWTRKRNILHERIERPLEDMRAMERIDGGHNKTKALINKYFGESAILPHTDSGLSIRAAEAAAANA